MRKLRLGGWRNRLGLHFGQRGILRMAAVEIGDGIGCFGSGWRHELVRDRSDLALVHAIATTTAAAATASTPARPAFAIALAVLGKVCLPLGFILVGVAFVSGGLERGARLAERGFAFLARCASCLAALATTAATPAPAPLAALTLAVLLTFAFTGF